MAPNGIFRSFKEARAFAHSLNPKNINAWQKWAKTDERPRDIPFGPAEYYKAEWQGWGHFLSSGLLSNHNRQWRLFEEARKFAHSLGLRKSLRRWLLI